MTIESPHPLNVVCPTCASGAGVPCFNPRTKLSRDTHKDRIALVERRVTDLQEALRELQRLTRPVRPAAPAGPASQGRGLPMPLRPRLRLAPGEPGAARARPLPRGLALPTGLARPGEPSPGAVTGNPRAEPGHAARAL